MSFDAHKNFAESKVAAAPSPATSGTSLTVATGEGTKFPTPPFNATAWPDNTEATAANAEIVRVTNITGDVLTITRAQESTTAKSIAIGWRIAATITKKTLDDVENATIGLVSNETPGGTINGSNTAFTTANAFATGSLRVYKNGIRLKGGGADYTETASGFSMVTAPSTGAVLLVDYYKQDSSAIADGALALQVNETPSGTVNGSNAVFTTSQAYIAGSTQVYRDGQLMAPGGADYTETTPSSGTITFVTAPASGSVILVTYKISSSIAANADAVDGIEASLVSEMNKISPYIGGWQKLPSLTRVSDTTATIPGDWTDRIAKGSPIYWLSNGTARQSNVIAISYASGTGLTTVTIHAGFITTAGDCAFVNGETITVPKYANTPNPAGFQGWFNYSAFCNGSGGSAGTYAQTLTGAIFKLDGNQVTYMPNLTITNKGSWSGDFQLSVPVPILTTFPTETFMNGWVSPTNSNTVPASRGMAAKSSNLNIVKFISAIANNVVNWTNIAVNDLVYGTIIYPI